MPLGHTQLIAAFQILAAAVRTISFLSGPVSNNAPDIADWHWALTIDIVGV